MALLYKSTRGDKKFVTASQAILKGIADDGGLYVPTNIPKIDFGTEEIVRMDYKELAYRVLRLMLDDFSEEELRACIDGAYDDKFDDPLIAPLTETEECGVLELFHGKTIAFKDMALSILPYLLKTSAKKNGEDRTVIILTATSGDTGKAALEGFANVDGTGIIVFFPQDGVSDVQKRQMITQEGKNTCVVGIKGNFDDCQTAVKKAFTDPELKSQLASEGYVFSSANSINIGRLAPQIVYYFYAYGQMIKAGRISVGDKLNFVVPTGNFGNILAGYYAKEMGLPVGKLVCASNENKVLYDFFKTGVYDINRKFILTSSPSMDILISSNLERLLYHLSEDTDKVKGLMEGLGSAGKYEFSEDSCFVGEYSTESETFETIKSVFEKENYVLDTHTAVAYSGLRKYVGETGDTTPSVVVSTASPFKFAKSVLAAIDNKYEGTEAFKAVGLLSEVSGTAVPKPIKDLDKRSILHDICIEKDEIKDFVRNRIRQF